MAFLHAARILTSWTMLFLCNRFQISIIATLCKYLSWAAGVAGVPSDPDGMCYVFAV